MLAMLLLFLRSFRVYLQSRADLQVEILALRHQIVVLQRQTPKPKLKPPIADSGRVYLNSGPDGVGRSGSSNSHRYRMALSRVPLVPDLKGSARTTGSAMCCRRNSQTHSDFEP